MTESENHFDHFDLDHFDHIGEPVKLMIWLTFTDTNLRTVMAM